jgi:3-phosphoshikimate 1-carboxyvinyltransferase
VARAFGAEIRRDADFTEFRIRGGEPYVATEYDVEGDWSGAAFLLVAGALAAGAGALEVGGLALSSSQPDRAIVDALALAGAALERIEGGWRVRQAPLRGFSFDATDCPDLFPPLVALASRCTGVTTLRGASRLRAKESDRAAALAGEFGRLGLRVDVYGDVMAVTGLGPEGRLAAGAVSSRGDHRIAMAAAVAALSGSGAVMIDGAESVAKSYPDFFEALDSIRLDSFKPDRLR